MTPASAVSAPVAPPIDLSVPKGLQTATFALGWFWGPDAQFATVKGIYRTRVGCFAAGDGQATLFDGEKLDYGFALDDLNAVVPRR